VDFGFGEGGSQIWLGIVIVASVVSNFKTGRLRRRVQNRIAPDFQHSISRSNVVVTNSICPTDKVKLIPPIIDLSVNGSRIRSGLIAIKDSDICLEINPSDDGVPREYRRIDSVTNA
jgi:hypothetical protein